MLLEKVHGHPINHQQCSPIQQVLDDTDDVYYRFGGAALAEMLHVRYNIVSQFL